MFEILAFTTLVLSSYLLVRLIGADGTIEFILIFFCVTTAQIALSGYLLSYVNHLAEVRGWALLGIIFLFFVSVTAVLKGSKLSSILPRINLRMPIQSVQAVKKWYLEETSGFEKLLLTPMILVTLSLGLLNLAIIVSAAPHNYDSMSHLLARMAYYLQHNNLDYYPANYWPQVAKMKNATLLFLYSYLMSGKNENLTQLVQFISYWVAVCGVYGIARRTGNCRTHSLFASLVSSLLVVWLMESVTTQVDMIIAAYSGAAIYFLFAFREERQKKYLALAALGIGLSLGVSAKMFLSLPSVLLVTCYVLFRKDIRRNLTYFAVALFVAFTLFALPAGYIDNYRNFGNPIEPDVGDENLQHITFKGKSIDYVMGNGTKNMLRFGFEFLTLDGLPPVDVVLKAQSMVRAIPKTLVSGLGIDLESSEGVIKPFRYQKPLIFFAHEDWSSWGIFGFALIWVVVFLSAFGLIRSGDTKILSYAAIVFLFIVAYGLSYEPHYTRYFVTCAVFAAPTVGIILRMEKKLVRAYVLLIVLLGCISAVSAVMLRPARPPVAMKNLVEEFPQIRKFQFLPESIFDMGRVGQLTTNARALFPAISAFDYLVPEYATVAVFLYEDTYEYPLFGEYLTRTIIPVNSDLEGFKGIPDDADYLLYAQGFPLALSHDFSLGGDWYLRRLSGAGDDPLAFFRRVVRWKPDHAPYRNLLGIEYAKRGLFNEAIEEFKIAIRLAPDEPSYRLNLDKAAVLN